MNTYSKAEKFWDRMANQFDKHTSHFEKPPLENAKKYVGKPMLFWITGVLQGRSLLE